MKFTFASRAGVIVIPAAPASAIRPASTLSIITSLIYVSPTFTFPAKSITASSLLSFGIYHLVLLPLKLEYLKLAVFILVIAALVQFVEMFLKKFMVSLYEALGVYLPLITTNCAVLGVALNNVKYDYDILTGTVNGFATAVGFAIAIIILAGIREKIEDNDIPECFKGMPIVLVTAGLMAIAFCGFSGLL